MSLGSGSFGSFDESTRNLPDNSISKPPMIDIGGKKSRIFAVQLAKINPNKSSTSSNGNGATNIQALVIRMNIGNSQLQSGVPSGISAGSKTHPLSTLGQQLQNAQVSGSASQSGGQDNSNIRSQIYTWASVNDEQTFVRKVEPALPYESIVPNIGRSVGSRKGVPKKSRYQVYAGVGGST